MEGKKEITPEEFKELQDQNKKLVADMKASDSASKKAKEIADQLAKDNEIEINGLKAQIESLKDVIKNLNSHLEEKEAENEKLGKYPVLTHKGKKYELVDKKSSARFDGKNVIITVEALKENSKLLDHCIKKGYSCLKEKGGK